jgi:hypothetical protein
MIVTTAATDDDREGASSTSQEREPTEIRADGPGGTGRRRRRMFRTYKLTPNRVRYTPILEVIRRRAAELERETAERSGETRRPSAPDHFSATA